MAAAETLPVEAATWSTSRPGPRGGVAQGNVGEAPVTSRPGCGPGLFAQATVTGATPLWRRSPRRLITPNLHRARPYGAEQGGPLSAPAPASPRAGDGWTGEPSRSGPNAMRVYNRDVRPLAGAERRLTGTPERNIGFRAVWGRASPSAAFVHAAVSGPSSFLNPPGDLSACSQRGDEVAVALLPRWAGRVPDVGMALT